MSKATKDKKDHKDQKDQKDHKDQKDYKKQKIPKPKQKQVWDFYCGPFTETKCFCCSDTMMSSFNFECGHVVAEHNGGTLDLKNLRPICGMCNRSMKTETMTEYMKRSGFKQNQHWNGYQKSSFFSSCLPF